MGFRLASKTWKTMRSLFLLLLLMLVSAVTAPNSNQPRFRSDNGHLYVDSATSRNISLNTKGRGGYINVNNENLLQVIERAKNAWDVIDSFRAVELQEFIDTMHNYMPPLIDGPKSLLGRVTNLEIQMLNSTAVTSPSKPGKSGTASDATKLETKLSNLEKKITNLVNLLSISECLSNPCQNGGTCMDMYNGFQCNCPQNWQGRLCELDVDECVRLAHTDLGCQNGAECKNTLGGYECVCPANWFGLHCTKRKNDCNGAQASELCGHGVCVNLQPSTVGYTCICDEGWTTEDDNRPACTKDVDECAENRHLCSADPPVECRNTKGSFTCGSCPPGYEGNGFVCTDVNECLVDNGGCSVNPRVQCINTRGSFKCESCPPGYRGDGFNCVYATGGACAINNGGCHPNADCTVYAETTIQCTCRVGYKGSGSGPIGCVVDTAKARDPCSGISCGPHGSCVPTARNASFTCNCEAGYTGKTCDIGMVDPCFSDPCENGMCLPGPAPNSFVCNCFPGFYGHRCDSELEVCGGYIVAPNGTLRYPEENTTATYGGNMICDWVIDVEPTVMMNISFVWIDVENSPNCRSDYVAIINGDNDKTVGKFCGNSLPTNNTIHTESSVVIVRFRSDQSRNFGGFQLNYTSTPSSISLVCGGEISFDSHGTLSSPGSPGKYPPDRDCYWTLNAPPGKRIQMHFFSFRFETHINCSFDYLEIRDGHTQNSPLLAILCNTTVPPPILTSGPHANLHFHSGPYGRQDHGFQMSYSVVEGIPGCGGVFTGPSGFISSPVNPASDSNSYLDNMNCEWHIRMPLNQKLRLSFVNEFDIEGTTDCTADQVAIYDGPNDRSPLIGRYCGSTRFVHPILTNDNEVTMIFKSDHSLAGRGFTIKYETLCGGTFTDSKGILESPFYPNPYPENKICTYLIAQPVGKAVKLSFLDMDIEDLAYPKCPYDSLEIRDGDNENSTKIASLCGKVDKLPKLPFISTHNYMWLKFETDHSNSRRGFRANYSTIDIACGGILKEPTGIVQSSRQPAANNRICKWIISVNESSQIQLTWRTYPHENPPSCDNEYVEIFDNSIEGNASKIDRYCGSNIPPQQLTSLGNQMTIAFRTENTVYMLSYTSISKSQACGGLFLTTQGFLKSPNFPDSYPPIMDCVWIINVPVSNQIELNITQFELEETTNCRFDYLEIRNGGFPTSPLIGKYCGSKYLPIVSSLGNSLYIRFVTDYTRAYKGFMLWWSVTAKGCGGTLNTDIGHITSPNYPLPVQETLECFYKIVVARGNQIKLTILDLELTTSDFRTQECKEDFIEFYDGGNTAGKSLGKYCSDVHTSAVLHSSTNQMYIKYRNSGFSRGRGFSLTYALDCNVTTRGHRGVIELSGVESLRMAKCAWTIVAPRGSRVNIVFTSLNVGKSGYRTVLRHNPPRTGLGFRPRMVIPILQAAVNNSCDNAQLIISEGDAVGETNAVLWKECLADSSQPAISSTKNVLRVSYTNVRNISMPLFSTIENFRMEWAAEGCGGTLEKLSGEFTSPGYPASYRGNTTCEWHIVVSVGYTVEITVESFWLQSASPCHFDYLAIYSGYDDSGPELLRLCDHRGKPITVTSSGNEAFVRFESVSKSQGKGFKATYTRVMTKCGGVFTAPRGYIHTSNYPHNYDTNSPCLWYIEVADTHLINLTFVDFLTRNNDVALVYDGDVHGKLLLNHSGYRVPPSPVLSSTNKLVVLFEVSNTSRLAKGFNAIYSTACGAKLVTNDSGIISNHQAYLTDAANQVCSWTVVSDSPQSRVTLTFTHIDVTHYVPTQTTPVAVGTQPHDECSDGPYRHTTFRVLDGRDSDSPEIAKFCKSNPVPPPIVSNGPAMRVEFVDNSGGHDRFSALYSVRSIACGGTYDSVRGTISSPNYPNNYYRDSECVWTLKSSVGNRVSLTFVAFELEDDAFCNEDYVEIRDTNSSGPVLGLFCGPNKPTDVTSGSALWVKFRSNSEGSAKGFTADFKYVKDVFLTQQSGEISSPAYPRKYRDKDDYSWTITVDEGKSVQIVVKEAMCTSYVHRLKIYDGVGNEAPSLFALSIDNNDDVLQNKTIISEDNTAIVRLQSGDRRIEFISFLLSWSQVDTPDFERPEHNNTSANSSDYDHYLSPRTNASVIITSPGYPYGYAANLNLTWTIHAEPHYQIEIVFIDVDLYPIASSSATETYSKDHITVQTIDPDTAKTVLLKTITKSISRDAEKKVIGYNRVSLTFITNKSLNGTGFKAQAKLRCGGRLRGPTGVIDLTNKTAHYALDDRTCTWNVTVRPGRTIAVKLLTVDLVAQYACTYSYVLLKNGFYADSSLVGQGKFCSNQSTTVNTIDNHLQIQVRLAPGDMVKIAFEEKSINCGGQINLNDLYNVTEITSPSYPNIPPAHIECIWTVMVPPGERISALIEELQMLSNYDEECQEEYVEFRDGASKISRLLHRVCDRSSTLPDISTTDNFLHVKYFTDINTPSNGFKLTVSIAKCGGTWRSIRGAISSPDYPGSYESADRECEYRIISSGNRRISLTFQTLSLKRWSHPSVGRKDGDVVNTTFDDSLTIYDVEPLNNTRKLITTIYGSDKPSGLINATGLELVIRFKSYLKNGPFRVDNEQGKFLMSYGSHWNRCDKDLNVESGEIVSPQYGRAYESEYCRYSITVPKGRRVTVEVIQGQSIVYFCDPNHPTDYRERLMGFIDRENGYEPIVMCPNPDVNTSSSNYVIESSMNQLKLGYFFDPVSKPLDQVGFRLRFSSDKPAVCGGTIDPSNGGSIALPPENQISYVCDWNFVNTNGTVAIVANFEVKKNNYNCPYDYMLTLESGDGDKLKTYCPASGSDRNELFTILSPYPTTTLTLKSWPLKGNMTATLYYSVSPCGGVIKGQKITITSPNYPKSFPEHMHCAWSLNLPEGEMVNIRFNDLDLECGVSHVTVHDGIGPDSPVLGKYCGDSADQKAVEAVSNKIWIEFLSSADNSTRKGFNLTAESTGGGCGMSYRTESGELSTRNYPQWYPNDEECEWTILLEPNNRVNLQFVDRFSVEQSANCNKDYAQVFDYKNGEWVPLGNRLCGRRSPPPFVSTETKLKIRLRTDGDVQADGFKAKWSSVCGGIYTETSGKIFSPNFPKPYPPNAKCNYTVIATGKTIQLTFKSLQLEDSTQCSYDNLTVYNGVGDFVDYTKHSVGFYCGDRVPGTLVIEDSVMIIFRSDVSFEKAGFEIHYELLERCGGEITSPGSIASPTVFDGDDDAIAGYPNYANCTWIVRAPADQVVRLAFTKFHLEGPGKHHLGVPTNRIPECNEDAVRVFDDVDRKNDDSRGLGVFCGNLSDRLPVVKSKTSTMYVEFTSDFFGSYAGFVGEISFTYGEAHGCGGTVRLNQTNGTSGYRLKAPNLPVKTELNCGWLILVDPSYQVQIEVIGYTETPKCPVNATTGCGCSSIQLFDGPARLAPLIRQHCSGSADYPPATSSGSEAFVLYSFFGADVNVTYDIQITPVISVCGPTKYLVLPDRTQVLTSPHYPQPYDNNLNCKWSFSTRITDTNKIVLRFTDVDLESSKDCSSDYLEVSYSYMSNVPMTYRLCHEDHEFDLMSETSVMLALHTNDVKTSKGFRLEFSSSNCQRTYTKPTGRIGFDDSFSANGSKECTFTINLSQPNLTVSAYVYMSLKSLGDRSIASFGLTAYDGPSTSSPMLTNYTVPTSTPPSIFSSGPALTMSFTVTDEKWFGSLDISYTSTDQGKGCGGTIFNVMGVVTSPLYPAVYRKSSACRWDIAVPRPYPIIIGFNAFHLGSSTLCATDYLEIYDVDQVTRASTFVSKYCGGDLPARHISTTGAVFIRYVTSEHNDGSGWAMNYKVKQNEI